MIPYRFESLHFLGLMNSATKFRGFLNSSPLVGRVSS